jgi:hypothetical protein
MKGDNPVPREDHWFRFPDLAQFPDYAAEGRRQDAVDLRPLYDTVKQGQSDQFVALVSALTTTDPAPKWLSRLSGHFRGARMMAKRKSSPIATQCFRDLYDLGAHCTHVEMKLDVSQEVDTLLAQPDHVPKPGSYDRGMSLPAEKQAIVSKALGTAGILQSAGAYLGRAVKVKNVFLHVATPSDTNWKQFFMDAKTTPRLVNSHFDPKADTMKALLYLEECKTFEQGAFRYCPTSHRFQHDPLQDIIGRAISTGSYCTNPESRRSVFRLPSHLRVSCNFGRCLLDGTAEAQRLEDKFFVASTEYGNVCVFDPMGIHQGGRVYEGHGRRITCQIIMG